MEMTQISVGDTIYFQDAYENIRHAANFRGWDSNNAVVVWNGMQIQIEKERLERQDNH